MRKTLEIAPLQVLQIANASAPSGEPAPVAIGQDASLKPWRVLDGFGKLVEPGERALPIPVAKIEKARASAVNPPGLYGPQNALMAVNAVSEGDTWLPSSLREPRMSWRSQTRKRSRSRRGFSFWLWPFSWSTERSALSSSDLVRSNGAGERRRYWRSDCC